MATMLYGEGSVTGQKILSKSSLMLIIGCPSGIVNDVFHVWYYGTILIFLVPLLLLEGENCRNSLFGEMILSRAFFWESDSFYNTNLYHIMIP